MAIEDIRNRLKEGKGPQSSGDFLVQVSHRLIDRMGPVLEEIDEEVDTLEEEILEAPSNELRFKLSNLRRKAISLRRYLSPSARSDFSFSNGTSDLVNRSAPCATEGSFGTDWCVM